MDDKLIAVSSPVSGHAELHTHMMDGNVMRMRRIDSLTVKPGTSIALKPLGDHLMLLDLKTPLRAGETLKLSLTFEKAGVIEVVAIVELVGATGPRELGDTPDDQPSHHQ